MFTAAELALRREREKAGSQSRARLTSINFTAMPVSHCSVSTIGCTLSNKKDVNSATITALPQRRFANGRVHWRCFGRHRNISFQRRSRGDESTLRGSAAAYNHPVLIKSQPMEAMMLTTFATRDHVSQNMSSLDQLFSNQCVVDQNFDAHET